MRRLVLLGLGNPGLTYVGTRHNVGQFFVETLAKRLGLCFVEKGNYAIASSKGKSCDLLLCKPLTFMNESGRVLAPLQSHYHFSIEEELLVVTDNVDLPIGRVRLKIGSSSSTHNGLRSVNMAVSGRPYARLLIGVGLPPVSCALSRWVLSRFGEEERGDLWRVFSFLLDQFLYFPDSWQDFRGIVNSFR